MTATARHSGIDRDSHPPAERISRAAPRWQKAIGIIGLVVLLWVGDRLYDVISSGSAAPGGARGPAGRTAPTQPAGSDTPTPGGGGHDPSQFRH